MDKRKWTHRVEKSAKGCDGKFFGYGTSRTFMSKDEADAYARRWADKQVALYGPIEIDVIQRRGDSVVVTYRIDSGKVERVAWA